MSNALPPSPAWTIGSILEQSYQLARDNFAAFITVTLVFSAAQALLAAKAGATFVSPFVGRLDDVGQNGMELISEIVQIYENFDFATEVLVASCRNPIHIVDAAKMGADVCTAPPSVIDQLFNHPLTTIGLERFLRDWEKAYPSGK